MFAEVNSNISKQIRQKSVANILLWN